MNNLVKCGDCKSAEEEMEEENEDRVWCNDPESENYLEYFDPEDEHHCDDFTRRLFTQKWIERSKK